jgi:N-acetylglutamate synthase-like GNAT family acetyltransferase
LKLRRDQLWQDKSRSAQNDHESDLRCIHFIAWANGELGGYVQYEPSTHRLRQLVVGAAFRGRQLGSRLVERVKHEAEQRGIRELKVHAWNRSTEFYEKQGFRACGAIQKDGAVHWQPMTTPLDE